MFDATLVFLALSHASPSSASVGAPPSAAPSPRCVISTAEPVMEALAWVEASREALETEHPLAAAKHGLFLAQRSTAKLHGSKLPPGLALLVASASDHLELAGERLAAGDGEVVALLTRAEAALHAASGLVCSPVFNAVEVLERHASEGQALLVGIAARSLLEEIDSHGPAGLADALVILYRIEEDHSDAKQITQGLRDVLPVLIRARAEATRAQGEIIDRALQWCRAALVLSRTGPSTAADVSADVHRAREDVEAAVFGVPPSEPHR